MKLVLNIDRIVLEGVPLASQQRDEFRVALADELATRLAGRAPLDALSGGIAVPRIAAAPVTLPAGAEPGHLAARVAQSLATGLAGPAQEGIR